MYLLVSFKRTDWAFLSIGFRFARGPACASAASKVFLDIIIVTRGMRMRDAFSDTSSPEMLALTILTSAEY